MITRDDVPLAEGGAEGRASYLPREDQGAIRGRSRQEDPGRTLTRGGKPSRPSTRWAGGAGEERGARGIRGTGECEDDAVVRGLQEEAKQGGRGGTSWGGRENAIICARSTPRFLFAWSHACRTSRQPPPWTSSPGLRTPSADVHGGASPHRVQRGTGRRQQGMDGCRVRGGHPSRG